MKKYTKPSLKGLGLLRVVTKFSGSHDEGKWGTGMSSSVI
jgi:hypothetical protein